jgi:hypothetical protein
MEEFSLLLGNMCAICYESALKEYLLRRWISCRIRRVFSCCCSCHLVAGSASALRKLLRGVAAALGGKEEERGRTKNDGNKIPEKRSSVRSVHQQVACKPWLFVCLRFLHRGVKLLLRLDANQTDALHELGLLVPALASKKQQI